MLGFSLRSILARNLRTHPTLFVPELGEGVVVLWLCPLVWDERLPDTNSAEIVRGIL